MTRQGYDATFGVRFPAFHATFPPVTPPPHSIFFRIAGRA